MLDATPMVGGIFGNTTGVAPGYLFTLSYKKISLYSEGEFVFDTKNSGGNFFYNWNELAYSPTDKTVIRAGYGIGFIDPYGAAGALNSNQFNVPFYYLGNITEFPFTAPTHTLSSVLPARKCRAARACCFLLCCGQPLRAPEARQHGGCRVSTTAFGWRGPRCRTKVLSENPPHVFRPTRPGNVGTAAGEPSARP